MIVRKIEHIKGIVVGGRNISNISNADDTVLIANAEKNSSG